MADKDSDSGVAEYRKKLATFSLAQRELIGRAIIDGLINPGDLVSSSAGGGNYAQDGGPYTQSGGGNHYQGGNGGYNQSKLTTLPAYGFDPAELVSRLVGELRVAEQVKTRG